MAAVDRAAANTTWPPTSSCSYHKSLLQFGFDGQIRTAEQAGAMDQYLANAVAVQSSMFKGADGKLSTNKDCDCWIIATGESS